jgi:hypothetical protein
MNKKIKRNIHKHTTYLHVHVMCILSIKFECLTNDSTCFAVNIIVPHKLVASLQLPTLFKCVPSCVSNVVFAITHFCETVRSMLNTHSSTQILVGMLFQRSKVWTKFNLSVEQYNQRVMMLNDKLHLESSLSQKYDFWKHKGLQFPSGKTLKDATHLNNVGNWRLATSIRGACVYFSLSFIHYYTIYLCMYIIRTCTFMNNNCTFIHS